MSTFGMILTLAFGASLLATIVFTARVRRWLLSRAILDVPNARSSHAVPVPRGGGIAIVLAVTVVWLWVVLMDGVSATTLLALALGLVLAGVSWMDDQRDGGLSARVRLGAQAVVVGSAVFTLPADAMVLNGLVPWWFDRCLTFLGWVWFINLFNFMDGIDGIAGVETTSIALGLCLLGLIWPAVPAEFAMIPAILAGGALGFLVWNWHPAKIFMGDVGSITLGFWLAWLLVHAAISGALAVALILPLYFLADATATLVWRLFRGEKVWQAHRSHYYQVAARGYGRHSAVVLRLIVLNITLIGLCLAWIAEGLSGLEALVLGGVATASLMFAYFRAGHRAKPWTPPRNI